MSRSFPGRAAWTALSLVAVCGCAATLHPLSVNEELARKDSRMVRHRMSIEGYFDNRGLYHETGGSIRSVGDRTLELRAETGHMRFETVRLSADSVVTIVTSQDHSKPFMSAFFVPLLLTILIFYAVYS